VCKLVKGNSRGERPHAQDQTCKKRGAVVKMEGRVKWGEMGGRSFGGEKTAPRRVKRVEGILGRSFTGTRG